MLAMWVTFCGRFTSFWAFIKTFLPFIIIVAIIVIVKTTT